MGLLSIKFVPHVLVQFGVGLSHYVCLIGGCIDLIAHVEVVEGSLQNVGLLTLKRAEDEQLRARRIIHFYSRSV